MLIKLDDAIAAVADLKIVVDGLMGRDDNVHNDALDEATAALRALPVSDGWEDIAEAARYYMSQIGQGYEAHKLPMGPTQIEADRRLRAALAALGPLPAPPSE